MGSISTERLIGLWHSAETDEVTELLYRLILETLSPQQYEMLEYVQNCAAEGGWPTTTRIEAELDIKQKTAATVLKQLYDWGLVGREQMMIEGGGSEYVYFA